MSCSACVVSMTTRGHTLSLFIPVALFHNHALSYSTWSRDTGHLFLTHSRPFSHRLSPHATAGRWTRGLAAR